MLPYKSEPKDRTGRDREHAIFGTDRIPYTFNHVSNFCRLPIVNFSFQILMGGGGGGNNEGLFQRSFSNLCGPPEASFLSKHNMVTIIVGIMIEVLRILKIRPLY